MQALRDRSATYEDALLLPGHCGWPLSPIPNDCSRDFQRMIGEETKNQI